MTLCELPPPGFLTGASWGTDDTIIFAALGSTGLQRVRAAGGEPESVTTPDQEKGETAHRWPHILPGGEAVLFTIVKGTEFEIALLSLDTGEIRTLLTGGSGPRYASTGHLVYGIDGTMWAVPFDLDRLEVTGDPVLVLEGVVTKASGAVATSHRLGDGVGETFAEGGGRHRDVKRRGDRRHVIARAQYPRRQRSS